MRLKEIKLAGFKSFVDPTTVPFPGNRSAVVGPNGCGKSNIIDAVRWVLGESSARQLRGEALTDVIFNGSDNGPSSRQPTAQAAVELVFDNRDGRVGGEFAKGRFASYAEIAIRREVDRDAHSTYYLNGTRCRRRDVADVFLGTGFGPRSYSIIEQGMVTQLVDAKPDELRAYLEEAAGISKYRERRRETQNRIKHTVENLDRIGDIVEELDRQLAHLKRQARAAERYRSLKDEERRRTAELLALRLVSVGALFQRQEAHAKALEVEHEAAVAARQTLDTTLEKSRTAHAELGDEQASVQGRYYEVGAAVARLEESIANNRLRLQQLGTDLEELTGRQRDTQDELEADTARIAEMQARIEAQAPELAKVEATDAAAAARLEEVERSVQASQLAWEAHADRAAGNAGEVQVRQSQVEQGEQVLQRLQAQSGSLDTESGEEQADAGIERLARQIEECARDLESVDGEIAANGQDLAAARQNVGKGERELEAARNAAQKAHSDLAALTAVQQAALGRTGFKAVERWLQANGLADAPRLGERLAVEPGWETAVETVLGAALEGIAVEDTESLAEAIDAVTKGRVTLFETNPAPTTETHGLRPLASCARPDLGSLLAGVFVADSLAEARRQRPTLEPGQSIVTREGVWMGADWIRVDKGTDASGGVVRRSRELEALREAAGDADARLDEKTAELADSRGRAAKLEDVRETLRERHVALAAELSRVTNEHDVRQVRLEEAAARARSNASRKQELGHQIGAQSSELAERRSRLGELQAEAETLLTEGEALRAARDRDVGELERAREAARATRDALHTQRVDHQALQASLDAGRIARKRLLDRRQDFENRIGEMRAAAVDIEAALPEQEETLRERLADRHELEHTVADFRRRMEAIEVEMSAWSAKRNEAQQTVDEVRTRLEDARVERERLAANRDNLQGQFTETGIDFEDARSTLPGDATEEQWVEALERLARRIARLGPINLTAIDEYEAQSERKRYLDSQIEDLEEALATLRNAIRRIDRDTRTRFKETFDRVNEHLEALFPRLFGGGRANLVQTGEDWLDTGVTLMAQPPGKRNASIHSLSGGEKAMTAVALIFSIFQLNPSPVCLLDEVDAPLDDANVVRFADLIREMSRDVQFVVVTHNKQTIETADHLLGVTMQEAGVSRLVSVEMQGAAQSAAV